MAVLISATLLIRAHPQHGELLRPQHREHPRRGGLQRPRGVAPPEPPRAQRGDDIAGQRRVADVLMLPGHRVGGVERVGGRERRNRLCQIRGG